MTSSDERPRSYSWRFFWLAAAIAAVVAAYTAGWHYAAALLVQQVNTAVANVNSDGRRAFCENAEARGFPFRIGVFCRSVMYEDARAGVRFNAGAFRSAAQVYRPWLVIGELDGPARLEAPGLKALDIGWESLRSSVRLASPEPERISVEGSGLTVSRHDEPDDASPPLASARTAELHMRPAETGHDVAARFSDLAFAAGSTGAASLPPLSGLIDMTVTGWDPHLRGSEFSIRTLSVSLGETTAGATISGPLSIGEDGLIDADLRITLREPSVLAGMLGDMFPENRREIALGLRGVAAMGETPTVPLRIVDGKVSLGFFVLGSIPPL